MTTRHTVEVGGQALSWLQSGRGRTAVLLHGFPLHAEMWDALHATTPHGRSLVTPDLRNFGQSRGTPALSVDVVLPPGPAGLIDTETPGSGVPSTATARPVIAPTGFHTLNDWATGPSVGTETVTLVADPSVAA